MFLNLTKIFSIEPYMQCVAKTSNPQSRLTSFLLRKVTVIYFEAASKIKQRDRYFLCVYMNIFSSSFFISYVRRDSPNISFITLLCTIRNQSRLWSSRRAQRAHKSRPWSYLVLSQWTLWNQTSYWLFSTSWSFLKYDERWSDQNRNHTNNKNSRFTLLSLRKSWICFKILNLSLPLRCYKQRFCSQGEYWWSEAE